MNENPERFWSHCGNIHRIPSRLAHNFPWKVSFQSEGFTELRNYDGCMWLKLLGHNVGGERNREGHCTITLHTCQKGFCKCQFLRHWNKVLSLLAACFDLISSPSLSTKNSNYGWKNYWKSGVDIPTSKGQKKYHSAHLSEGVLQMSIFSCHWKKGHCKVFFSKPKKTNFLKQLELTSDWRTFLSLK